MAQRKKRGWIRERINPWLDDFAGVATLGAGYGLSGTFKDFKKDVRRSYVRNVNRLSKKKVRKSPQLSFMGKKQTIDIDPVFTKSEAKMLKSRIYSKFRESGKGQKFRFFKDLKRSFSAMRNPYTSSTGFTPEKWQMDILRKGQRKKIFKIARRYAPKSLLFTGLAFGSVPLAHAIQADYSSKRKFKKEFKKSVRRGAVTPTLGYIRGERLDKVLTKYPALRGSKRIRALEGKYAQQYGQGVQFWRGTSGLSKAEIKQIESGYKKGQTLTQADIKKIDRYFKTVNEYRRRAKRSRGK